MEDEDEQADAVKNIPSIREFLCGIMTAIRWLETRSDFKECTFYQAKRLIKNYQTKHV